MESVSRDQKYFHVAIAYTMKHILCFVRNQIAKFQSTEQIQCITNFIETQSLLEGGTETYSNSFTSLNCAIKIPHFLTESLTYIFPGYVSTINFWIYS